MCVKAFIATPVVRLVSVLFGSKRLGAVKIPTQGQKTAPSTSLRISAAGLTPANRLNLNGAPDWVPICYCGGAERVNTALCSGASISINTWFLLGVKMAPRRPAPVFSLAK